MASGTWPDVNAACSLAENWSLLAGSRVMLTFEPGYIFWNLASCASIQLRYGVPGVAVAKSPASHTLIVAGAGLVSTEPPPPEPPLELELPPQPASAAAATASATAPRMRRQSLLDMKRMGLTYRFVVNRLSLSEFGRPCKRAGSRAQVRAGVGGQAPQLIAAVHGAELGIELEGRGEAETAGRRLPACPGHDLVRVLVAEPAGKGHHHRLGHDGAVGEIDVAP